jgi:hypothetical protein
LNASLFATPAGGIISIYQSPSLLLLMFYCLFFSFIKPDCFIHSAEHRLLSHFSHYIVEVWNDLNTWAVRARLIYF